MNITPEVVALLSMGFSFLVCLLLILDRRLQARVWRDTLVYMKSRSAYEAEDAIDRNEGRTQGTISKVLAQKKKERENLREVGAGMDPAEQLRSDAAKAYDTDTRATKPLPS